MAHFRNVGNNVHINLDNVVELIQRDTDNWVTVVLVNGREQLVDRQYIEDLLVDDTSEPKESAASKKTTKKDADDKGDS